MSSIPPIRPLLSRKRWVSDSWAAAARRKPALIRNLGGRMEHLWNVMKKGLLAGDTLR